MARIGSSGPAVPAWLKAADARFRCRDGGILWRPPAQLFKLSLTNELKLNLLNLTLFGEFIFVLNANNEEKKIYYK